VDDVRDLEVCVAGNELAAYFHSIAVQAAVQAAVVPLHGLHASKASGYLAEASGTASLAGRAGWNVAAVVCEGIGGSQARACDRLTDG